MKPLITLLICFVFLSCSDSAEQSSTAATQEDAPKIIPGIAAVDVYGKYEQDGFTVKKDLGAGHATYTCEMSMKGYVYSVRVLGKNASSINKVEATVTYPDFNAVVPGFIGYAASVPYTNANGAAATQWAKDHINTGGDTTIGTVRFVLTAATPTARVLSLYAH